MTIKNRRRTQLQDLTIQLHPIRRQLPVGGLEPERTPRYMNKLCMIFRCIYFIVVQVVGILMSAYNIADDKSVNRENDAQQCGGVGERHEHLQGAEHR